MQSDNNTRPVIDGDALLAEIQALPPARREAVLEWFTWQRLIAKHAGISREAWFVHVRWALDHPLDFSFVEAFPDLGDAEADDTSAERREDRSFQRFEGQQVSKSALTSNDGRSLTEKTLSSNDLERELFTRIQKSAIDIQTKPRSAWRKQQNQKEN